MIFRLAVLRALSSLDCAAGPAPSTGVRSAVIAAPMVAKTSVPAFLAVEAWKLSPAAGAPVMLSCRPPNWMGLPAVKVVEGTMDTGGTVLVSTW